VTGGAAVPADVIIPLAIGNQWVTQINGWDSAGHPQAGLMITNRIVRDTVIQMERWYLRSAGPSVTNRSTGFWIREGSLPELYLKYPAVLGDKYVYGGDTVQVTARDTTIAVSAGTFSCRCYTITYTSADLANQLVFVCPNKGMIRSEVYHRTPGGQVYLASRGDLISFQLK
jgi:hypothetical protein